MQVAIRSSQTILALALALLSACTPVREAPPAPLQLTPEQFTSRRLDDPALEVFLREAAADEPRWDMAKLTAAAIFFQPSLALAKAQLEVARAAVNTAAQKPNPSISAGPGYDSTTTPAGW